MKALPYLLNPSVGVGDVRTAMGPCNFTPTNTSHNNELNFNKVASWRNVRSTLPLPDHNVCKVIYMRLCSPPPSAPSAQLCTSSSTVATSRPPSALDIKARISTGAPMASCSSILPLSPSASICPRRLLPFGLDDGPKLQGTQGYSATSDSTPVPHLWPPRSSQQPPAPCAPTLPMPWPLPPYLSPPQPSQQPPAPCACPC